MTTPEPADVVIPGYAAERLRALIARAVDEDTTREQRHIARVELVGALGWHLNGPIGGSDR